MRAGGGAGCRDDTGMERSGDAQSGGDGTGIEKGDDTQGGWDGAGWRLWGGTGMEQDGTGMEQGGGACSTSPLPSPVIRGPEALPGLGVFFASLGDFSRSNGHLFHRPVSRGVREQGQPCAGLGSRG